MKQYLQATPILDFNHSSIQKLIAQKKWDKLDTQTQILELYNFVRDDIKFGFNVKDTTLASKY